MLEMSKLCLCGPARQEELQMQSSLTTGRGDLRGLHVPGSTRTHGPLQPPWRQHPLARIPGAESGLRSPLEPVPGPSGFPEAG